MSKKAFTLVELMGVIIVLGIITLLIAPTIISQIRNSKDKIDKATEKLIYTATDLYLDSKQSDYPKYNGNTYCLTLRDLVEDGKLSSPILNSNGDEISLDKIIAVDVTNNSYSYRMTSTCENNTVKTLPQLAVVSPSLNVNTVASCATDGTICKAGTAFAIKVNTEETYKFYVLNDDGEKVTLIMNQNLYEDGNTTEPDMAWINASDYVTENNKDETPDTCDETSCNDEGPITAINALNTRTATWDYITAKPYTYSGVGNDGKTKKYEDITVNMKARMITYAEATSEEIGCTAESESCPSWLHENLYITGDSNTYGYWTSTADASDSTITWFMSSYRSVYYTSVSYADIGVRPVIELYK